MRRLPFALAATCLLVSTAAAQRPSRTDSLARALDAQAPGWLRDFKIPALAVAYVHHGTLAWTRVYGERAAGTPATAGTLFNVASLTKPVFAEVVLRAVAAGKMRLDDPLDPYWVDPDVARDARHAKLTARLALSHRTGFANWRRESGDTLRFVREPGGTYGYSGEGFEYLRRALQTKLHGSLDGIAAPSMFAPFGMTASAFATHPWFAGRLASGLGPDGAWSAPTTSDSGNGADQFRTTIGDYGRLLARIASHRDLPAALAAQRDSIQADDPKSLEMCDPKVAVCPVRAGYGLGWSILEYADDRVLWHTGVDPAERAMVIRFPTTGDGAVLLTNGANGFDAIIEAGILLFGDRHFADYLKAGRKKR